MEILGRTTGRCARVGGHGRALPEANGDGEVSAIPVVDRPGVAVRAAFPLLE
jgi:hypothetical protein